MSKSEPLQFTKMQALGNDFVVLDGCRTPIKLTAAQIKTLGDRHFGIGFDQLLIIEPTTNPTADFNYRIFNQNGGEVDQCGNGARAIARFVQLKKLSAKKTLTFATRQGLLHTQLLDQHQVRVDLGEPIFTPADIPFIAANKQTTYRLTLPNSTDIDVGVVSLGNPHAVLTVADVASAPVETLGPHIQALAAFPQGINVGFMQIINQNTIKLRVYERGTGETLACGSGACAAVAAGIIQEKLDPDVQVELPGGVCQIQWAGPNSPVLLTGPAELVFEGTVAVPIIAA